MTGSFAANSNKNYLPEPEEEVMDSIFKQYERVVVESLITSFGLDFLIRDQHGGDVDTIHNVRQVGKDSEMAYKNKANQADYENRGAYNSYEYHSDKRYIEINRQAKIEKESGNLYDAYTGEKIGLKDKTDLDHTISAKEIHDDAGRVLAGLKGTDLANSEENLNVTNPNTNRSKKADSMNDFLDKRGDKYTEEKKANMRKKDEKARKAYESKIAKAYYTSPKFAKDISIAAVNVGARMGVRQALGFVFAEMWFAIKEEFKKIGDKFDFGKLLKSIGDGIKRGFENAKNKYKELFAKLREGAVAGALSSLTTTLLNIFFSTAKNVVRIIRQTYASIVQAGKVLLFNPDNLSFGERMRAVTKILATGASVVAGTMVMDVIGKTPIAGIPVIGDIVKTFCGAFVTGILSCSLLYFLDRSDTINKLVSFLDNVYTIDSEVNYFRRQAEIFEKYAAELMNIDLQKFKKETEMYSNLATEISEYKSEEELNIILRKAIELIGVKIPWEGEFDDFMMDKSKRLVFE